MSEESLAIIKTSTAQLKIKKSQLAALETKQTEENDKLNNLSKLLDQAKLDHETCMRATLAGNATAQDLKDSKAKIIELNESIQECRDALKFISEVRPALNHEIIFLKENITAHRAILCSKLFDEAQEANTNDKKFRGKMMDSYAMFLSTGHFDRSWLQHLLLVYPHPNAKDLDIACEKFKANHEFMRD